MATGNMVFMDSDLADLDKLLQSLEIENKLQQNEIQKEQQQAEAFESAITEKQKHMKILQDDTARLDEETKAAHQQFRCNKETYESLKNHYLALLLNQETVEKEFHDLQDRWQVRQAEHERILQHYESIWEQYKTKYEEKELAVELRQWQQQIIQTRERLEESHHKVKNLEAAIQEIQDKKKNALKPFKSQNDWIIRVAKVWAKTRDLRRQKEEAQLSIDDARRKIQEKKLQQQREQEEQVRKQKLKEAEEKKCQEELEREKQQKLHQQQQLQQLKVQQQHQQQQQQQQLRQQQLQIPQSPLQQQSTRRAQSQYFQSPLIAAARSTTVAASPQQIRQPPYLQMPIMTSPCQVFGVAGANNNSEKSCVPQQFARRMSGDSASKYQKQPQSAVSQLTKAAPPCEAQALAIISTHETVEASMRVTNQSTITTQDEQIKEDQKVASRGKEVTREIQEPDGASPQLDAPQTLDPISLQDPSTPGSVPSLPPRSPFDLDAHLQSLNEMAKSPGFTYSCRPMFGAEIDVDVGGEPPSTAQAPACSSSSDNFESPFFQSFLSRMDGTTKSSSSTPMQLFGPSSNHKESSHPTAIFGRTDSPKDIGQSRTQDSILSLFGGGQDSTDATRNDEEGSPAGGFTFNFTGGSASPNVNSSSQGSFTLF